MSIKNDTALLEKYNELRDIGSMSVTILQNQVLQVVVADLINKYKANKNNEYGDKFLKVLEFYLTDDEIKEIEAI